MNKIEKAIENLKEIKKINNEIANKSNKADVVQTEETCDLAIKALEKQVGKKPIDTEGAWVCPRCKSNIYHEQQLMHCRQCGQLISWR